MIWKNSPVYRQRSTQSSWGRGTGPGVRVTTRGNMHLPWTNRGTIGRYDASRLQSYYNRPIKVARDQVTWRVWRGLVDTDWTTRQTCGINTPAFLHLCECTWNDGSVMVNTVNHYNETMGVGIQSSMEKGRSMWRKSLVATMKLWLVDNRKRFMIIMPNCLKKPSNWWFSNEADTKWESPAVKINSRNTDDSSQGYLGYFSSYRSSSKCPT